MNARTATHLARVTTEFDRLNNDQKVLLMSEAPQLYVALARLIRSVEAPR